MKKMPRRCSSRRVMHDGLEKRPVHLSLVVATQQEEDRLAHAGRASLVADETGEPVHEPVARKKLAQAHCEEKPLKGKYVFL